MLLSCQTRCTSNLLLVNNPQLSFHELLKSTQIYSNLLKSTLIFSNLLKSSYCCFAATFHVLEKIYFLFKDFYKKKLAYSLVYKPVPVIALNKFVSILLDNQYVALMSSL